MLRPERAEYPELRISRFSAKHIEDALILFLTQSVLRNEIGRDLRIADPGLDAPSLPVAQSAGKQVGKRFGETERGDERQDRRPGCETELFFGEQRKNETVLAVVNRFAEARRSGQAAGGLTLGLATGQTGKENTEGGCRYPPPDDDFRPWLEFKGIPVAQAQGLGRFLGEPDTSGENLRFVDLWWADVLRRDFADVGQEPAEWTKGLLARLEQKRAGASPEEQPPTWALVTVREIRELALRVETLMRTKAQALRARIFNEFLGDVQVYGEYVHCRGLAVRRFHRVLARVEAAHAAEFEQRNGRGPGEDEKPRYTVVAHSLGSVMALDALLYAHAREDLRATPSPGGHDLPFPEYVSTADVKAKDPKVPVRDTSWIRRVDAFVTLGSPIDKFLVLWWQNYRYLNVPHLWMDAEIREIRKTARIRHFNYADEQDPVGHNLDVAATAPAVAEVFERTEDVVFNRYPVPGVAHNAYWGDRELFSWILKRAVDGAPAGMAPRWFDPGAYRWALLYSYRLLPLALLLLSYFALSWGFYTSSWHQTALAGATIVLSDLNQHVMKVLESAQLMQFFVLASDEEEALEKLKALPDIAPESAPAPEPPAAPPSPAKAPRTRKRATAPEAKDPHDS